MGLLLLALVALAAARLPPSPFKEVARSPATTPLTFNLGLFQHNTQQLFDTVLDRADPDSPRYSHWLSIDEVNAIVSPPASVKNAVRSVLAQHRIRVLRDGGDFFRVTGKASDIEALFNTTVAKYRSTSTGRVLHRAKGYTIPASLKSHVEIISGLTELPRPTLKPKQHPTKTRKTNPANEEIIPEFLRYIYNIPQTQSVEGQNATLCVAEFQDDNAYLKSDMALFYKNMAEPAYKITDVGPYSTNGGPDAESSLDIQFGGALARGAQNYFWVDLTWMLSFAQAVFARPDAPTVISMSWGWPEDGQCESGIGSCTDAQDYVTRTNTEFAKVTARGITLVAASGDQGAPGDNHPNCGGLSDLFPASSPWVVAVGATMLGTNPNNTAAEEPLGTPVTAPVCHKNSISCARGDVMTEEVCTYNNGALITSGGGFSQYTAQPSWQAAAVQNYVKNTVLPPSSMFNSQNRAFPDVSALGHNYLVYLQGQIVPVDGTSCSSPVFAAIVSLINAQRLKMGKRTLGFFTPALYKAPASAFHDITKGDNKCTSRAADSTASSRPRAGTLSPVSEPPTSRPSAATSRACSKAY